MRKVLLTLLSVFIFIQSTFAGNEGVSQQENTLKRELSSSLAELEEGLNEAKSSGDLSRLVKKFRGNEFRWIINLPELEMKFSVQEKKELQGQIEGLLRKIYVLSGQIQFFIKAELRMQILYSHHASFSLIKDIFEDSWEIFKNIDDQSLEKQSQIRIFISACSHANFDQEKWIDRRFDLLSDFTPNDQCSMMESLALNPHLSKAQSIQLFSLFKNHIEIPRNYFSMQFITHLANNRSAVKEIGEMIFGWLKERASSSFQNEIYKYLIQNPSISWDLLNEIADISFFEFYRSGFTGVRVERNSFLVLLQTHRAIPLILGRFESWMEHLDNQTFLQVIFFSVVLKTFHHDVLKEETFTFQRKKILSKIIKKLKDWNAHSSCFQNGLIQKMLQSVLETQLVDRSHIDDLMEMIPSLKDLELKRELILTLLPMTTQKDQLKKLWAMTNGFYKRKDRAASLFAASKNQVLDEQDLDWCVKRARKILKGEVLPWEPFPDHPA